MGLPNKYYAVGIEHHGRGCTGAQFEMECFVCTVEPIALERCVGDI